MIFFGQDKVQSVKYLDLPIPGGVPVHMYLLPNDHGNILICRMAFYW